MNIKFSELKVCNYGEKVFNDSIYVLKDGWKVCGYGENVFNIYYNVFKDSWSVLKDND